MEGVESRPQLHMSSRLESQWIWARVLMLKVCPAFFFTSHNYILLNHVSVRSNTFPLCADITTAVSRTLPSSQTETLPIKQRTPHPCSTVPGTSIPLSVSMKSAYSNSLVAGLYDALLYLASFILYHDYMGHSLQHVFKCHSFSDWILLHCTCRPQLLMSICSSLMDNWVIALWLLWMTICGSLYTCIPVTLYLSRVPCESLCTNVRVPTSNSFEQIPRSGIAMCPVTFLGETI